MQIPEIGSNFHNLDFQARGTLRLNFCIRW